VRYEARGLNIPVHTLPLRRPYDLPSILGLAGILREGRYDVVNTHSGIDSWIGGIAAKLAGVPVLVRTRHLNIPLRRSLLNFVHYLPDLYITCGQNMRENLVHTCSFPEDRVISIPTGVDIEAFHGPRRIEAKVKYGLPENAVVITNVGILRKVKGHEVTLRSVKGVIESIPEAMFLIVGDGPRRAALEAMVHELGIADHVTFTGFVENVAEVYSFSDVSVLSSLSEGLPQSLLQSMAAGCPVAATRVGGVSEVVVHEQTGLLVESGDHLALAQAIIRLISNREESDRFAAKARDLVIKEHSLSRMIDAIEHEYGKLLEKKR
jgi:glycosyltransferase involved in cell wall biosynthesis